MHPLTLYLQYAIALICLMLFTYVAAIYGFLARPGAVSSEVMYAHFNHKPVTRGSKHKYLSITEQIITYYVLHHFCLTPPYITMHFLSLQFNFIRVQLTASVQNNASVTAITDRQTVETLVRQFHLMCVWK